jgi:hypothetical protein
MLAREYALRFGGAYPWRVLAARGDAVKRLLPSCNASARSALTQPPISLDSWASTFPGLNSTVIWCACAFPDEQAGAILVDRR